MIKLKTLYTHDKCKRCLICFPFACGGTIFYRNWVKKIPFDVELKAILLPGREELLQETLINDIEIYVHEIYNVLKNESDKPIYYFGHSMGAILAYEICHLLKVNNSKLPEKLFVSGFRAPHLPNRNQLIFDLPDDVFIEKIQEYEGLSEEVLQNAEIMELIIPTFRADMAAIDNYKYTKREPLNIPIIAFGGGGDKKVNLTELASWKLHSRSSFNYHMFDGGHFYLDQKIKEFLKQLNYYFEYID